MSLTSTLWPGLRQPELRSPKTIRSHRQSGTIVTQTQERCHSQQQRVSDIFCVGVHNHGDVLLVGLQPN